MSSPELPYFCPRCGDKFRFPSVPQLQTHLVSQHTYETLLVLSQTDGGRPLSVVVIFQARVRSSRPGVLLPLPGPAVPQTQSSSLGPELHSFPLQLACLDLASSSASVRLLREMFGSVDRGPPASTGPPEARSTVLALPGSLGPFPGTDLGEVGVLELGLSVGIGLEERLGLGLDRKIARTFAEVEERVSRRMSRLRATLERREAELERERWVGQRLRSQKLQVEERAAYLSRQVSAAVEMMERLKKDLEGRDEQEMTDIKRFLRVTAEKEAEAKTRLQTFIETLLERADRAERQLLQLSTHTQQNNRHTHSDMYTQVYTPIRVQGPHSLDGGDDNTSKLQRADRADEDFVSGSGGLGLEGEGGWGRTWSKRNRRHHSTEEEEDDEEGRCWSSLEMRRLVFDRTLTPASGKPRPPASPPPPPASQSYFCSPHLADILSSLCSTPSRCHGDGHLGADTLKLRAGLFCVFPYLDVRSLLRAAEVCSDWRFVARHPAVWTRLCLENARVSTEFLTTLSQWCTQTQSVILNNLKSRSRRADEPRDDYHRDTRGVLESGVEALLRSAGGSLLHLSVSQCPHVLTDRTLWLASCYCRNLQTLTYRSSSDPLGQEVLWALGAGCRNIISLQVAPAHPCQQHTRFGNRCLQTIGRCWPHLRSLSVGGAGCGTQGLVAVVRTCAHLQVLELERITDLGLQAATELCRAGLKSLQMLILVHTPVSGQAILHFHSVCANIRSIVVEISVADYFEEPDSPEAQRLFGEILVLQKRPELCDVLQVKAEGFF
uniref:Si:ch73-290k24.5 n=1 Tax=Echeneis naucrates TaxID=173247 RepID=A0A665U2Y2_ECHNA